MGIRIDFLIKHVRPNGLDSMETILCNGALKEGLSSHGVSESDIDVALTTWAARAELPINNENAGFFVEMAQQISLARWEELYTTNKSTILFLNGPLIKELSFQSEKNKGKKFEFNPAEYIPLAVTINKDGSHKVHRNVESVNVMADENGFCFHLDGLDS